MVNLDLSNFLTGNVFLVLLLAGFILAFFGKTFFPDKPLVTDIINMLFPKCVQVVEFDLRRIR